jgi:pimeloyl-ACP methyl ester carboxylesterase
VAQAVHAAVLDAGFDSPVLVGHSLGGLLATLYAARYPVAGVVNADQPLGPPAPFARAAHSLEAQFRGPGFAQVWAGYQASMHMELVPETARPLLRAGERAAQEILLTYWAELFALEVHEVVALADEMLAAVRRTGVPYIAMYGDPIAPELRAWVKERLPGAEIIVWPVGHHFPHLAHPARFAGLLRSIAAWSSSVPSG